MQLKHKLNQRLAFFLPFMLAGLVIGLLALPITARMLFSTIISLAILWLVANRLAQGYDPRKAKPLLKAVLSLLAGFTFSMFWAATSWFPEGSAFLSFYPWGTQAAIIAGVSLGLVLAIWKTFAKCVEAFFGDIVAEFRKLKGNKRKN